MEINGPMHPLDKLIIASQNNVIRTCLQIIKNKDEQIKALRMLG